MEAELPFANQEGSSIVEQNSRETLVNMFAEVETAGRARLVRRQRAGVKSETALTGTKRCIEKFGSNHYLIVANTLYSYDGTTATSLGTISSSTGRCTLVFGDGGTSDILISDGTNLFHWNGAAMSTITRPTSSATGAQVQAGYVTWLSGYGLFHDVGTHQLWWTDTGDLTTITATNFASAESHPDPIVRVFADHNEIWLFGTVSTEVWSPTSDASAPFARIGNATMERGCGAALSVVADDNSVFWLGNDFVVYRADGFRPSRISNHSIERLIAGVTSVGKANATAFVYTVGGNKFYTLNFPDELSIQYNIATGFWNKAETYTKNDWQLLGSAGKEQGYYLTTAGIVSLSQGLSTDEGGVMRRGGISAPIYAGGKNVILRSWILDAEMGRAAIGVDADVMLRVARDGESFGNERVRSLGPVGDYRRRAAWRNLGRGREIMVEFYISDATEFNVMGASGNIEVASY